MTENTGKPTRPLPPPNPVTRRHTRQETLRQIYFPLGLALLGLGVLVWWLVDRQIGNVQVWANIATLLLGLPALVLLLVVLGVLLTVVIGISIVLKRLPPYTRLAQDAVEKLEQQIRVGSNLTVKPIITLKSYFAMVESLFGLGNGKGGR